MCTGFGPPERPIALFYQRGCKVDELGLNPTGRVLLCPLLGRMSTSDVNFVCAGDVWWQDHVVARLRHLPMGRVLSGATRAVSIVALARQSDAGFKISAKFRQNFTNFGNLPNPPLPPWFAQRCKAIPFTFLERKVCKIKLQSPPNSTYNPSAGLIHDEFIWPDFTFELDTVTRPTSYLYT